MVFRSLVVLALCALLAGGWWAWRSLPVPSASADDPVAAFLERHWDKPLAPQGTPPAHFSAGEASLDPAACGECHPQQHRDWQSSLHSRTMGSGILWQARTLPPDQVAGCLDCHAPLAEQKVLLGQELDWPGAPQADAPDYIPPDLHRRGLVCAACHVRQHTRFGPPPTDGKPPGDTPGLPHDGFVEQSAFADSRFCATCHQFPSDGPALNGKLLENTLNEWRVSRHAAEGRTCQSCHMPGRRHLWRGIHDPDMVLEALSTDLSIEAGESDRPRVRATVRNSGAGHYFPTYLVPKVRLRLLVLDESGAQRLQLSEATLGRRTDVWLSKELDDTRLAPGEQRVLQARLPVQPQAGWRVALQIDVAPREHYERMFATVLRENSAALDAQARGLLEAALSEARAARYSVTAAEKNLKERIAN